MDPKEIKFVMSDQIVPADLLVYKDPVYGERIFTRKGAEYVEQTKGPLQPIRKHSERKYAMSDSASFVAVLKKCAQDSAKGLIFYQEDRITAFLEEDNRDESVSLPLKKSLEMQQFFSGGLNEPGVGVFNQKSFLKLLDTFPECVTAEGTTVHVMRALIEKMALAVEISFESNLDPDNLEFLYKEKAGGGSQSGKLPKKITLSLPYYEGSKNKTVIHVDLDIVMPKAEGDKPKITITDVKHARTKRDALEAEIASLKTELTGWLFVNGQ